MAGDLLEQWRSGRSARWLWRQAMNAVWTDQRQRAQGWVLPALFAAVWSAGYSIWRPLGGGMFRSFALLCPASAWPGSALLEAGCGLAPAMAFVWLGVLLYLMLRPEVVRALSGLGVIGGLSASANVLLVCAVDGLHHLRHPQMDLGVLVRGDFFSMFGWLGLNVAIAASVLTALLCMQPQRPGLMRRKRVTSGANRRRHGTRMRGAVELLVLLFAASHASAQGGGAAAKASLIEVDKDVRLEVLDWGGEGRPLVFLAGLGNDAHVFDRFAPQFTAHYHVYGITRRGFGNSSKPVPDGKNYDADRLGDDVLAVMDALKLDKPILVGHSLAGEELSSVASRYPERVAGVIYLDAAYGFAYYDRDHGDLIFDFFDLKRKLDDFMDGKAGDPAVFKQGLMRATAQFDRDLQEEAKADPSLSVMHAPNGPLPPIVAAINLGARKYESIPVPALAIFACPHNFDFDRALRNDPEAKALVVKSDEERTARQADAFATGVPSAQVVRIANADHYVFRSNEAQVAQAMNTFLASLR